MGIECTHGSLEMWYGTKMLNHQKFVWWIRYFQSSLWQTMPNRWSKIYYFHLLHDDEFSFFFSLIKLKFCFNQTLSHFFLKYSCAIAFIYLFTECENGTLLAYKQPFQHIVQFYREASRTQFEKWHRQGTQHKIKVSDDEIQIKFHEIAENLFTISLKAHHINDWYSLNALRRKAKIIS